MGNSMIFKPVILYWILAFFLAFPDGASADSALPKLPNAPRPLDFNILIAPELNIDLSSISFWRCEREDCKNAVEQSIACSSGSCSTSFEHWWEGYGFFQATLPNGQHIKSPALKIKEISRLDKHNTIRIFPNSISFENGSHENFILFSIVIAASVILYTLNRLRFSRRSLFSTAFFLPILIAIAPSPSALGITMISEATVIALGARLIHVPNYKTLFASFFINALTQPALLIFMQNMLSPYNYWSLFLIGEFFVWILETALYIAVLNMPKSKSSITSALFLSFVTNGVSATVGTIIPVAVLNHVNNTVFW